MFYSLREDHCLNFVLKPTKICYEFDGIRPETLNFEGALGLDEKITEMLKAFQIPFIHITIEDLQERTDFVTNELFKCWPDLKRGQLSAAPQDDDNQQNANIIQGQSED